MSPARESRGAKEDTSRGPAGLGITPEAKRRLREALGHRPAAEGVRIFVRPGVRPVPGMQIDRAGPSDLSHEVDGIRVLIDRGSARYLVGATVDYAVTAAGEGFRVTGPLLGGAGSEGEARASPSPSSPPPSPAATALPRGPGDANDALLAALRGVYDPEIPVNIVDLGLIYGIDRTDPGSVRVRMTMTSPGCPVAGPLAQEVERVARGVPGIEKVAVEVVWEPPWSPERMSPAAKRQFGYA